VNGILIGLIKVYQYALSPLFGQRCKYYPSCSSFAIGALREHGLFRAVALAGWRLLRCNPFSDGGYDPVPPRSARCKKDHADHGVSAPV
jgi:uncharacterized protein